MTFSRNRKPVKYTISMAMKVSSNTNKAEVRAVMTLSTCSVVFLVGRDISAAVVSDEAKTWKFGYLYL